MPVTSTILDRADVALTMREQRGTGAVGNLYQVPDVTVNSLHADLGTGSVLFPDFKNPGFEFDGTASKYIQWSSAQGLYNNAEQSIVCCFIPHFHTDDNNDRYLYDSENGKRYLLIKRSNAQGNVLWPWVANTQLPQIAEADYRPHWKAYGKNVSILSATSGNNNFWLNGAKLIDGDVTAWSPLDPATIQLGIYYGKNNYRFDGIILHFSIYSFMLTDDEVDYLTGHLFRGAI